MFDWVLSTPLLLNANETPPQHSHEFLKMVRPKVVFLLRFLVLIPTLLLIKF